MCNSCTKNNNENIVGFVKFTSYPNDLATKGFFLQNLDDFTENGSPLIRDCNEGKIKFSNGESITYKELIELFNQKEIYCQSYVSCFTTLKFDDFKSDGFLKNCTVKNLQKYADKRDFVLFGSDLNRVFCTLFGLTTEFHNKYFKKKSYKNCNKIQQFDTVNYYKYKTMFSTCAWSCIYNGDIVLNDNKNSKLISELKERKMLETENMISISKYANFVDYSDETYINCLDINSLDELKQYIIQNIDNKDELEKLLILCLCNKETKYSLENEYRLLITEFSDTDIQFPKAIKLLYPEETNNTDHTKISQLNFPKKGYASLKDIKLTDFKDVNLQITSHY